MAHIYLYGIIEGTEDADLGISGVDGAAPVRIVAGDGLGGMVSDYTGEPMASLSKEGIVRGLLRHQEAIERVMRQHTVLPVKFGTLLESVDEVRALLSQRHLQLADALTSIKDMVEIDVAATWDTARVLQEIGREKEVSQAKEQISRGGSPTVAQQVQLGQMVKARMDSRRSAHRDQMAAFLLPAAVQMLDNALISDQLVMNVAFLVGRDRQREFDAAVRQLDGLVGSEITFRMVGPLPPYSFSTLEVSRLAPVQISNARQVLQLTASISVDSVRMAYRRLAALAQQSLVPDSASAQDTLVRLRQASELLLQCCSPNNGWLPGNDSDTTAGWYGDSLFMVAIKRAESQEIEPARFGGFGEHWQ